MPRTYARLRPGMLAAGLACSLSLSAPAADYKSAHLVEAGDVISADMLNELFAEIEDSQRTLTEDDLVGTWRGTSYALYPGGTGAWVSGPHGNFYMLTNVLMTITREGDDSYRLATSSPNPFNVESASSLNCYVSFRGGMLFGFPSGTLPRVVDRISPSRIRMMVTTASSMLVERPGPAYLILLDKQELPPEKPHLSLAEAIGQDVVLLWQDNSDNEDGFAILRRDQPSGDYTVVQYAAADSTCCTNAVPTAGSYWYRVAATNGCGMSLGSNVKRVVVP